MSNQDAENESLEQLPRTVHLIAGKILSPDSIAQNSVHLPFATAKKSSYLSVRIQSSSVRGDSITIEIPGVYPAAIKLYAWWLQFENVPLFLHDENGPVTQPHHTLTWRECFDLIQAHLLGSKFGDVDFQRYILGQLDVWLEPQQGPDLELLDYLWEKERDGRDELLYFCMSHMFQMGMERVKTLVGWMRWLFGGRRMMNYIEDIRESGDYGRRGNGVNASATKKSEGPDYNSDNMREVEREGDPNERVEDIVAVEEVSAHEPVSRDNTPPYLYRKARMEVQHHGVSTHPDTKGEITVPEYGKSQRGNSVPVPRPATFAAPKHTSTQRAITSQNHLGHSPQALRIHPKALASIANTNIHAAIERQRTSSPQHPPPPNLHPSLCEALRSTPMPTRPRKLLRIPQKDHAEMRRGASPARNTATMPDASLSLLDFWTGSSPSDLPGPNFWADRSTEVVPPNPKHQPSAPDPPSKSHPQFSRMSPATKQILHSFSLTRTPTPPRRATRSWSVASTRPSAQYSPSPYSSSCSASYKTTSCINRPGRGIISRKPVPEGGLRFLREYGEGGERLVGIVRVNSRPGRVGLGREEGKVGCFGGMGWEGRPGTA